MRTIYKFKLDIASVQTLMLPTHFDILYVGTQGYDAYVWIELDTADKTEPTEVYMFGAGHNLHVTGVYHIGTVMIGPYVWHYYMLRRG